MGGEFLMNDVAKTPWHLWVVGIVALLWNGGGAYDYTMTQTRNMEYLQQAADNAGVSLDVILDYYTEFPAWADAVWAMGVWGAVAGSILLLIRNRFAFHAFVVSILGLLGTTVFTVISDLPEELDTSFTWVFTGVIWVITLGLTYYSKRMADAGVLR